MEFDRPAEPVSKQNLRLEVVKVSPLDQQKLEVLAKDLSHKQQQENSIAIDSTNGSSEEQTLVRIILDGVWTQNRIIKHSVLHLLNPIHDKATNTFIVNNSTGFMVLEPDKLLTCTFVASSLFCERKTWLNHVFLGQVGTNRAMLVGTLVHEVFQYGVKNRIADIDKLTKYLDDLLDDATVMLETYSVELHLNDIRKEAVSYISSVKEWIDKYMFSGPRFSLTNAEELEVKITGISDIEENVWSTKYGLKGKIDVTGAVRIYDKRTKSVIDKTIPLELKTGNPNLSSSHAAQVSLYSMMIEDRYSETNQGFVIYLKDKAAMHNIALTHNIKRDLIQRRNQINYHMKNYFLGPEMIDQTRMCKNCERLTECVLMSDLYTPGKISQYSGMKSLENEAIGHLDERFKKFFQKYHEKLVALMSDSLQTMGDSQLKCSSSSFWTYTSEEAETRGTGFGKLQAKSSDDKGLINFSRHPKQIEAWNLKMLADNNQDDESLPVVKKQKINDYFKPAKKFSDSTGQQRQVSGTGKPFNTKLNFSRCRIAISLDSDEQNMDSQNSSTAIAIGFMNELKEDKFVMKIYEGAIDLMKPDLMYRVDKLEKRSQIDIERTVLVRLLARDDWRCDRIRQLILDPSFKQVDNVELNLFVLSTGFDELKELGARQQDFVVGAVSTDNYSILNESIEPKRTEINKIVSVLARVIHLLDRTTLIVAQNVDHLIGLMRILQQRKIKFILIDDGKSVKARNQFASNLVKVLQSDSMDLGRKFDVYIRQHEMAPVVITSYAMSVGGLLFTRRKFDYCIAYDCDTTELLVGLSPMFCSDRYVIIDVRDDNSIENVAATVEQKKHIEDVTLGDHLRSLRSKTNSKVTTVSEK